MLYTVIVVDKEFLGADFEYPDHHAIATVLITAHYTPRYGYQLTLN